MYYIYQILVGHCMLILFNWTVYIMEWCTFNFIIFFFWGKKGSGEYNSYTRAGLRFGEAQNKH